MKIIKRIIGLLTVFAGLYILGDFLNLPLWPTDIFHKMLPVEIRCHLSGLDPDTARAVLAETGGIELSVKTRAGRTIQTLNADTNGSVITVLPADEFLISAKLAKVHDNRFYNYTTRSPTSQVPEGWVPAKFSPESTSIELSLYPQAVTSTETLRGNMIAYLKEGHFSAARVLAGEISQEVLKDIDLLIFFRNELSLLPSDAYDSSQDVLENIQFILTQYFPGTEDHRVRIEAETIDLDSRLEALRNAQHQVIESYLSLIDGFWAEERYRAAYEEWVRLMNNPQLRPFINVTQLELRNKLEFYRENMPPVRQELIDNVAKAFDGAVKKYRKGDLLNARLEFTQLLADLRNMHLGSDFPEMEDQTQEYLDDIGVIAAANEAIKNDRLRQALLLFDTVLHPNDLTRHRIEETRKVLKLIGKSGADVPMDISSQDSASSL